MKGKISVYYDMPNVAKFRSRVANPSKELTSDLRNILTQVAAEVINENILAIRAKFIAALANKGIEYTSDAHKAKVESVLEGFFDVIASAEKPAKEESEEVEDSQAPAEDWN